MYLLICFVFLSGFWGPGAVPLDPGSQGPDVGFLSGSYDGAKSPGKS